MLPYEELGRTITPDGRRLTLLEHAGDYYIELDGQGLMSTRAPGSERALAEMACDDLRGVQRPRMLIGGLGLGFTLGAALDGLPRNAHVVVAEVFHAVVEWNRKFSFESAKDRLADPRVAVEVCDIVDLLRKTRDPYDAILLDVDNGPDAWSLESNDRLYNEAGVASLHRALKPGRSLLVWSAQASHSFPTRLTQAGFKVESTVVRSRGRKGERHTIFRGRKPGA